MMDILPIKRRRPRRRSNAPKNSSPMVFLPEELLVEILPFFNVKTIMQLKCLSKSWLAFISDSNFVEKHLKKSSQNPYLILRCSNRRNSCFDVVPYPVYPILKNPSINLCNSPDMQSINHCELIGSCNGLLCLFKNSISYRHKFCLWNPATRKTSKDFGLLPYDRSNLGYFDFAFGYDASTRGYKIVAFRVKEIEGSWKSEVKVFSVGDNCWRNIESFPVVPFIWFDIFYYRPRLIDSVHFSGTVNWLAVDKSIVSLYLSTESYKQFLLPLGFDEVPFSHPVLRVLMDSLCFSYDSKKTEFVLWQMKQYGVHESWTQLFKISYLNLQMHNIDSDFQLACLYVNGDMVIFANKLRNQHCDQAFIYSLKDKTIERIKSEYSILWFDDGKDYVESLVSVP